MQGKKANDACTTGYCVDMVGGTVECMGECTVPGDSCQLADKSVGACYNLGDNGKNACLTPGNKVREDACGASNECTAGMACFDPSSSGTFQCYSICAGTCSGGNCEASGLGYSVCVEYKTCTDVDTNDCPTGYTCTDIGTTDDPNLVCEKG